jgi:hypothetical protein
MPNCNLMPAIAGAVLASTAVGEMMNTLAEVLDRGKECDVF